MGVAGIGAYRREVVASTPCPDCLADRGELCTKISKGSVHGEPMTYVHDGRSFLHHVNTLIEITGSENRFSYYGQ